MDFGYFTLSDNHYLSNTRTPNQFVADITAEALYAEEHALRMDRRASFQLARGALLSRHRAGLYRVPHPTCTTCAGRDRAPAPSPHSCRRAVVDARPAQWRAR